MVRGILHLKKWSCNKFYLKKPLGIHYYCCNDAVPWLNEAKNRMFQCTMSFKIFEIHLDFVCLPAVRPGCARCTAPEISDS